MVCLETFVEILSCLTYINLRVGKILKKSSHASLIPFWEMKSLCSCASLKFVWACQKAMAIYETSPKMIDIQGGYNKNYHENHWTN